jgi:ribonuclease BN (tRNA processing enzyme)
VRLTVLGGQGAFPTVAAGCSGYVVSGPSGHLLVDPGWGTFRELLGVLAPHEVDAVVVTHGHPDHCADLLPLLRARTMDDDGPRRPLHVLAPAGAVEPLLLGEPVRSAVDAIVLDLVDDSDTRSVAGFDLLFAELPHHVPNLGVRISGAGVSLSYTGDAGPSPATVDLARDVDLHLAEATHVGPDLQGNEGFLCDVATAVRQGADAGARHVMLTHLWPGTDPAAALAVAESVAPGLPVSVALPGTVWP